MTTPRSALGLPYPPAIQNPTPAASRDEVKVLDWAGFASALSYTFDDGQPSQIEHYGELEASGAPLTFYVSAGWENCHPGFAAAWAKAAKDGHELGNHTVHHSHSALQDSAAGGPPLPGQDAEIAENERYIREVLGQEGVWSMASPYGDKGWSRHAGRFYLFNRGVGEGTVSPNDRSDPLDLPVFLARGGEREEELDGRIASARAEGSWLIFVFHALKPTREEWYAPVPIESVIGSIGCAKAAGDIWIDSLWRIAAYWYGQKIFSSAVPDREGGDLVWRWQLPKGFPPGSGLRAAVAGGTLRQNGKVLPRDPRGFYEVSLDALGLRLSP